MNDIFLFCCFDLFLAKPFCFQRLFFSITRWVRYFSIQNNVKKIDLQFNIETNLNFYPRDARDVPHFPSFFSLTNVQFNFELFLYFIFLCKSFSAFQVSSANLKPNLIKLSYRFFFVKKINLKIIPFLVFFQYYIIICFL